MDIAVDHEIQQFLVDAIVIDEGRPLGRRAIGGDARTPGLQFSQLGGDGGLQLVHPAGKAGEIFEPVEPRFAFFRQQRQDRFARRLHLFHEDAQAAAVDRQQFDMVEIQPMPPEQMIERGGREIAQMLVIDGVEFAMVDQRFQIGRFDHRHAIILQQRGDPGDEAVGIGYVGQHVVAMDDIGLDAPGGQLFRIFAGEEGVFGGNADGDRRLGRAFRRIDAEHGDAVFDIVLQQIAIIAGQFDHQRLRPQLAVGNAGQRMFARMRQQRRAER